MDDVTMDKGLTPGYVLQRVKTNTMHTRPYHTRPRQFTNLDEGDVQSLHSRRVACRAGSFVVGLKAHIEDKFLFAGSGIVVELNDTNATILTCASIFIENKNSMPRNAKILVYMPNHEEVPGIVSHFDLHHNIATLTVPSIPELRVASLASDFNIYFPGTEVVAVCRQSGSCNLLASCGEVRLKDYGFDSEDVQAASCQLTDSFVGGPLVAINSELVIGISFYCSRTVFLPSTLLLRCLKHFRSYGKIVRPWLGIRSRNLDTLKVGELETIYLKFPNIEGIYVDKVIEGSPAESAGVCVGDVITHCDGIPISSPHEYVKILFDKAENFMERNPDRAGDHAQKRPAISVEVVIQRESSNLVETKSIIIDRLSPPENNRWPKRNPMKSVIH